MGHDELVFVAVLVLRLGVPLLIPRFPLPAILAALVLDAADQTIFQNTTDLDLDGYQSYDKALDVYYLTVAYLSTIRNWTDPFAFRTGQFLWYYRLAGVLVFEVTGVRAMLLIFPNTFEYFFIAYEAVRLRWDPSRLGRRQVLAVAGFIWVFVKLPQEWWIHVAQLDFTDVMREDVLGVPLDTSWIDALGQNLWFVLLMAGLVGAGVLVGRRVRTRLPPPDWALTVDVDRHLRRAGATPPPPARPIVSWYVAEKIALVSMVTTIFALVLPDVEVSALRVVVAVGFVIVVNAVVSTWLARRGADWGSVVREFAVMTAVNLGAALGFILLVRGTDDSLNEGATVFFVLLLTLIVTLFDRYHRRAGVVSG